VQQYELCQQLPLIKHKTQSHIKKDLGIFSVIFLQISTWETGCPLSSDTCPVAKSVADESLPKTNKSPSFVTSAEVPFPAATFFGK